MVRKPDARHSVEIDDEGASADEAVPMTTEESTSIPRKDANPAPSVTFEYVDHFSLRQPSSTVRSRGVTTRVYDVGNEQLQLQQHSEVVDDDEGGKKDRIRVVTKTKRLGGTNLGLLFLRLLYGLVALLVAGFTALFAANVIVMQAMEIPRNYGEMAGTTLNVPVMIANILSLPLLVYSMASLVLFCLVFAWDVWTGHGTLRLMLPEGVPRVVLEWYSFVLYLGIPILVFCVASFAKAEAKVRGRIAFLSSVSSFLLCFVERKDCSKFATHLVLHPCIRKSAAWRGTAACSSAS